jgi:hypothetical protein
MCNCDGCEKNKLLTINVAKNIKICLMCYVRLLFWNVPKQKIVLNDVNWRRLK